MRHKRKFNKSIKGFVMLALAVVIMTSSVFAVDPSPSPTPDSAADLAYQQEINEYIMSQIVYQCMAAWGIEISYNDFVGFTDEVSDMIVNWVFEYLETIPSVYTINQWIAPWQAGYDYWGNWSGNASLLEDCQDFVDWLISKFNLTNNSTIIIDGVYTMNGYTLYKTDTWYSCVNEDGTDAGYVALGIYGNDNFTGSDVYFFVAEDDNSNQANYQYRPVFVSLSTFGGSVGIRILEVNSDEHNYGSATINNPDQNNNGVYYKRSGNFPYYSGKSVIPATGTFANVTGITLSTFMTGKTITEEGDNKFLVDNIVLPVNNADYAEGDSITIIDGEPFYIEITFPDHITVDNLPAVIVKPSVENPNFNTIWHYVSDLNENVSGGTQLLRLTMSELPEEVLGAFYAFLALGIIFGFIKIMRK